MPDSQKQVCPSQIYTGATKEAIIDYCKEEGWRIVDFRPPRPDDNFLAANAGDEVLNVANYDFIRSHRLIVERITPR